MIPLADVELDKKGQQQAGDSICQRLRRNDPSLCRLTLTDERVVLADPSFEVFLESLQENTSVQYIFVGEAIVEKTSEEQLNQLLTAMGQGLRGLKALEVTLPSRRSLRRSSSRWKGASLARFLQGSSQLESLVVWNYLFLETQQDIRNVAHAVREHPTLQQLAWMHVMLREGDADNPLNLDEILRSLATAPNLRTLQLAGAFARSPTSNNNQSKPPTAMRDEESVLQHLLVHSPCLESLSLRNLGLTDVDGLSVVHALATPPTKNQLKVLDLRYNRGVTRQTYDALLAALRNNRILALQSVVLDDDDFYKRFKMGFRQESLAELMFYTKLNRYGRGVLLDAAGAERGDCIEVLVHARDSLDALYHLLRCKPSAFIC
jgi:hypothetical protein